MNGFFDVADREAARVMRGVERRTVLLLPVVLMAVLAGCGGASTTPATSTPFPIVTTASPSASPVSSTSPAPSVSSGLEIHPTRIEAPLMLRVFEYPAQERMLYPEVAMYADGTVLMPFGGFTNAGNRDDHQVNRLAATAVEGLVDHVLDSGVMVGEDIDLDPGRAFGLWRYRIDVRDGDQVRSRSVIDDPRNTSDDKRAFIDLARGLMNLRTILAPESWLDPTPERWVPEQYVVKIWVFDRVQPDTYALQAEGWPLSTTPLEFGEVQPLPDSIADEASLRCGVISLGDGMALARALGPRLYDKAIPDEVTLYAHQVNWGAQGLEFAILAVLPEGPADCSFDPRPTTSGP